MTDMDLLKLAAKAAGFDYITTGDEEIMYAWEGREPTEWNPLVDDGDALRLAVRLRMNIEVTDGETFACSWGNHSEKHGVNPMTATRRAIVRAAAEIGEMGEQK